MSAPHTSNTQASFHAVKSAFDSGDFNAALQQLLANPADNATYYYNLGTTYLKLGKAGRAVAYLEKANRFQPHDVSIQQNLKLARTATAQTIGTEKLDPASTWSENIADNLRLDEIRGAFGLVGFVIALFWIRSYLKTRRVRQTLLKPAGLLGMIALGITLILYGTVTVAGMNPAAVCLDHESIRSGPGLDYVEVVSCEAGMKVRILGPTAEGKAASPISSVQSSATPSNSPSSAPVAENSPTPVASATLDSSVAAPTPQLWRQIRYSSDGIGWIRASSLLLL